MKFYAASDTGRVRELNEDFCFATDKPIGCLSNLFVVCDGMGGHNAGEYASENAIAAMVEHIRQHNISPPVEAMTRAIEYANEVVFEKAQSDESKKGMGTTLVAATVYNDTIFVANVGDSRCYVCDAWGLRQVSRDHSYVEEMVQKGLMARSDARYHMNKNVITRAIGVVEEVKADFFDLNAKPGTKLLLCTDGLTNMVSDSDIKKTVNTPEEVALRVLSLIRQANDAGGTDNITAILVEL